ncbi:MAG TPA: glycosyltransferase family 39 protein [Tepidisphaeraceae bacterium]|nr:glycosyltransferase family 39 protein [Tepidisphaeraceae bacterium]
MRITIFHVVVIVLAVWGVYGQALQAGFVKWDDESLIVGNAHVAKGRPDGLLWQWEHSHEQLYIPVVYTAWWCIAATIGMKAWAFHAANLVVFSAAACIAYAILRMLIGQPWPALAGALLLAIHPLQVEPVAWATGMKDVLCLFFCLAAIALYLRPRWYWAATICFGAAMLCKPSAVMVPVILLVIDGYLLRRPWRRVLLRTAPWMIAAGAVALLTTHLQPPSLGEGGPIWARPLIATDAVDWYLQKLVLPMDLGIDPGRRPNVVLSWHVLGIPWVALAWMIPAAIAGILVYLKRPVLTVGALIFVVALTPMLGLQPFDFQGYSTVAARYASLALLGPALIAAWCLTRWKGRGAVLTALAVLCALAIGSSYQTTYWHDNVTLFTHASDVNPSSAAAHFNLACVLIAAGDQSDAEIQKAAAFRAYLDDPEALNVLARLGVQKAEEAEADGRKQEAREDLVNAIEQYAERLKLDPTNAEALRGMKDAQTALRKVD